MLEIDTDNSYSSELCRCAKSHPAFVDAQFSSNGREGFELVQIIKPDVVIIDSIQTTSDPDISSAPGNTSLIRLAVFFLYRQW